MYYTTSEVMRTRATRDGRITCEQAKTIEYRFCAARRRRARVCRAESPRRRQTTRERCGGSVDNIINPQPNKALILLVSRLFFYFLPFLSIPICRKLAEILWKLSCYSFENRVKVFHIAISDCFCNLFYVYIFVF